MVFPDEDPPPPPDFPAIPIAPFPPDKNVPIDPKPPPIAPKLVSFKTLFPPLADTVRAFINQESLDSVVMAVVLPVPTCMA